MNYLNFCLSKDYKPERMHLLKALCKDGSIEIKNVRQACHELGVKLSLRDEGLEVIIADKVLSGNYLARGYLEDELKQFAPQIVESLSKANTSKQTMPDCKPQLIEPVITHTTSFGSITATIDTAGLESLSAWVKPKAVDSVACDSVISLHVLEPDQLDQFDVEAFIHTLKQSGITLSIKDGGLNIYTDASNLTAAATLGTLDFIKTDIARRKDKILQHLQKNQKHDNNLAKDLVDNIANDGCYN